MIFKRETGGQSFFFVSLPCSTRVSPHDSTRVIHLVILDLAHLVELALIHLVLQELVRLVILELVHLEALELVPLNPRCILQELVHLVILQCCTCSTRVSHSKHSRFRVRTVHVGVPCQNIPRGLFSAQVHWRPQSFTTVCSVHI